MEIVNMKKIFLIILFSFLVFSNGYAADGKGEATEYTITMKKVELCEDAACTVSTTVGETDLLANIASATAGADVGSYAATTGLPIGTTFTHLRVTISRTFTVTGSVVLAGNDCFTDGQADSAQTQMLVGTIVEADVLSSTMIISTAGGYTAATGARAGDVGDGLINISYAAPEHATSISIDGDNAVMIYALTNSYTVGVKAPTIRIKFNTTTAIGADNTACAMWVDEPEVTIALVD